MIQKRKLRHTNSHDLSLVHLNIGDYHFDEEPVIIRTVLGSCVSVCLFDPNIKNRIGMNHIFLPGNSSIKNNEKNARYGIHAMEILINEFVKRGSPRSKLQAKVFGGGIILDTENRNLEKAIGPRNVEFVKEYLQYEKIPIVGEDTGGNFCRTVKFNSVNFEVMLKKFEPAKAKSVLQTEEKFREKLEKQISQGKSSVTLF